LGQEGLLIHPGVANHGNYERGRRKGLNTGIGCHQNRGIFVGKQGQWDDCRGLERQKRVQFATGWIRKESPYRGGATFKTRGILKGVSGNKSHERVGKAPLRTMCLDRGHNFREPYSD